MTLRDKYIFIQDNTDPVINKFIAYSSVVETTSVGFDVLGKIGRVMMAIAFLYWKEEPCDRLDSWGVPLTDGFGNATFEHVNQELPCLRSSSGTPRIIHCTITAKLSVTAMKSSLSFRHLKR